MEALDRIMANLRASSQKNISQNQTTTTTKNSYKCPDCKDTGWIMIPQEHAQASCKPCKCRELEKVKNQWNKAGINPEATNQTFSNFKAWNSYSQKAKELAIDYYKSFQDIKGNRKNSIMLCGQVGSGKTHLSMALAQNFLKKGIAVLYMPYRDILTKIKQNMLDQEFYKKELSKYQTAEVLLIDDLFKGKTTETDVNVMFEIINYRYMNHLPIIVSTEFGLERLLSFDEAVGSRIYEMCKDFTIEIPQEQKNNYRLISD